MIQIKYEFQVDSTKYYLAIPSLQEIQISYEESKKLGNDKPFPYWGKIWPSAKAMKNFLLEGGHALIKNKQVMEIGSGLGLPSFIASQFAATVIVSDYHVDAIHQLEINLKHWPTKNIQARLFNWQNDCIDDHIEILLLSDLNYDAASHESLIHLISLFLSKPNNTILLSTPDRIAGANFIENLSIYIQSSKQYEIDDTNCFVYILQKKVAL
ncbi:MAG: protein N-lysine methyltransferase family protein [Sediminibacterium sp.]|nr:protein N-lysine methyltransferase family protein [Sediminibacterium sp.]